MTLLGRTASWYTNPQTLALCKLLDIENKINPAPPGFKAAQAAAAVVAAATAASLPTPSSQVVDESPALVAPIVEVQKPTATNGPSNGVVPSAADELAAAKKAAMAELDSLVLGNEDEIVMDDEDI